MPRATALLLVLLFLAGCSSSDNGDSERRLVATTAHVADLVRHVAGDRASVTQLLPADADPHDYEPRPSDAQALAEATTVFRSGGEVDEWLGDVVGQAGGDAETVTLIDSVERLSDDPHWWHDARNAQRAVAAIRDALVEADPDGAETYRRNARAYGETLIQLDADVADCVDRLPRERRKLVTTHDSLRYFAARYGFDVVGAAIPSLSSQAQPSAAATERLVDQIREHDVPAIFPEQSLDPRLEEAIAREADAEVAPPLWADTLAPDGDASTYTGALEANTQTIVAALSEGRLSCRF
jgi:ABC-type Zn uptake system ZnuABC Zn-binding protein ZnuA